MGGVSVSSLQSSRSLCENHRKKLGTPNLASIRSERSRLAGLGNWPHQLPVTPHYYSCCSSCWSEWWGQVNWCARKRSPLRQLYNSSLNKNHKLWCHFACTLNTKPKLQQCPTTEAEMMDSSPLLSRTTNLKFKAIANTTEHHISSHRLKHRFLRDPIFLK